MTVSTPCCKFTCTRDLDKEMYMLPPSTDAFSSLHWLPDPTLTADKAKHFKSETNDNDCSRNKLFNTDSLREKLFQKCSQNQF